MHTFISVVRTIFVSIAFLAVFLTGALLYLLLSPLILSSSPASPLLATGKALYHWIGIVSLGLVPLGIYLLFVVLMMVLQGLGKGQWIAPPREALELIVLASPAVGVLGTLLSLLGAISSGDIAHHGWQALHSLLLGSFLALLAFGLNRGGESLLPSPGRGQGLPPVRRDPARNGEKGPKEVPKERPAPPSRLSPHPPLAFPAKPRPKIRQETEISPLLPKTKDPRGSEGTRTPEKSPPESSRSRSKKKGRRDAPWIKDRKGDKFW